MMTSGRALQLAKDAFSGSTSYFDANIRPRAERDLRAFQSLHPTGSKYLSETYRSKSKIFRPKTRATIRRNEAIASEAFFSTLDVVDVSAEDETIQEQQASAEVMKALLEYRLKKSIPWFQTVIGAYQDAMTVGTVISHQYWEFDASRKIDRPVVELVPLENFRFDPAANWTDPVGTSPYLIQLIPMYLKDVKRRMRQGPNGEPAKWLYVGESQLQASAANTDSTRILREGVQTDKQGVSGVTEFSIVWVHRNIVQDDDGEDVLYYTLGDRFLLSEPVPLKSTKEYAHGVRPYAIGCCVIETHRNYPSSSTSLTREVQSEINELANQRIDNVKLALAKRYFARRNAQVDLRSLTRNVSGSVTLMQDPEKDVKVFDTPDVTASSYQEQDRLNLDFDEVSGTYSPASVQSNRRLNETVGGMTQLSDSANMIGEYQLLTFAMTWMTAVLRQLVLLEQHYETDKIILALAGRKASLFQRFGIDSPTDEMLACELSLSVNVGKGATNPTSRINNLIAGVNGVKEALADGVMERYGVNPTEIIKEVFGALGHKDGGRFFVSGDEDPKVAALQTQVDQLTQQLESKMPQAIVEATVRKLDAETEYLQAQKVTKGVEGSYAAMQAAEVIAAVPQVAAIADKVMQTAGYIAPTPPGIDPNFPTAALAPAAQEAAQTGPLDLPPSGNTSPMFPAKPGGGTMQGIETQAADGTDTLTGVE